MKRWNVSWILEPQGVSWICKKNKGHDNAVDFHLSRKKRTRSENLCNAWFNNDFNEFGLSLKGHDTAKYFHLFMFGGF